jgi:hypothetical protein
VTHTEAEAAFTHFLSLTDEGERAAAYARFLEIRNTARAAKRAA